MNINKSICTQCGGVCCKTSPCLLSPRDCNGNVESKLKQLKLEQSITVYAFSTKFFLLWIGTRFFEELSTQGTIYAINQLYSISKELKQYNEVYVIRMRSINSNEVEFVESEKEMELYKTVGACVKLLSSGCKYSDDERPYGGLSLIPDEQGRGINFCKKEYSLPEHAQEWLEYHSLVQELFFPHEGDGA